MARDLSAYFSAMAKRLAKALPADAKAAPGYALKESAVDPDDFDLLDWDEEGAALGKVLRRNYVAIADTAFTDVSGLLGQEVRLDLNSRGMKRIIGNLGARVKGITAESRDRLQSIVKTAIDNGDSPARLAQTMLESVQGWAGLEDLTRSRATTIARTETAQAYTWASAAGYRDSDLVEHVLCLDSPDCGWDGHDDAEEADQSVRSLDEMEELPTSHPNCVRAFAPIVAGTEEGE